MADQSTFQKALTNIQAVQPAQLAPEAITNIYNAYKSGKMTSEDKAQFEADVKAGNILLPSGASLDDGTSRATSKVKGANEPKWLPQAITDAYVGGKMTPEDRSQLEADMQAGLVKLRPWGPDLIPDFDNPNWKAPTEQGLIAPPEKRHAPSTAERAVGVGETAATLGTGATTGTVGNIGGVLGATAAAILDGTFGTEEANKRIYEAAMEGQGRFTFAPRTETGQRYTENAAQVAEALTPVAPMAAELGTMGQSAKATLPAAETAARQGIAATESGVRRAATVVSELPGKIVEKVRPNAAPTAPLNSAGSMGVVEATKRRMAGRELPVPVELTEGQATRDFGQLRFEQEASKNPELGAPLRDRQAEQNAAVRQSFDAWVDQTGAQAPDVRGVGTAVDKALTTRMRADKARMRAAYKEAKKAPEAQNPVDLREPLKDIIVDDEPFNGTVVDYLNSKPKGLNSTALLDDAKKYAVRLGVAEELDDGTFVARQPTVRAMEDWRREISQAIDAADATGLRDATILKKMIDAHTEPAAGPLFSRARRLRKEFGDRYENHAVIADLVNNKRGMADRKVALEDAFDRIVFRGSLDDMRTARRTLMGAGPDGKQAWKEIQGQALRYIKDQATKNVQRDHQGNEVISAAGLDKAIKRLDQDGKLEHLFGTRGADQLRSVNDLAKVMFTAPPGTINHSNTASVILAAMDMALSGSAGVPLPVLSGFRMVVKNMKDRKLKAQINHALNRVQRVTTIREPVQKF